MAKAARFDQGFSISDKGDSKEVRFRGDGMSWSGYVVLPLIAFIAWEMFTPHLWIVPFAMVLGMVAVLYLMFQSQSFTMTPAGIEKDGKLYDYGRVAEVVMDNPMDRSVSVVATPGVIAGGSGITGAAAATIGLVAGTAATATVLTTHAIARSSARRRFRVRIRYGTKMVTLGRNLKQEKAAALFDLLTRE